MKFINAIKEFLCIKPKTDDKWPNPLPQMRYLVAYHYNIDGNSYIGSTEIFITKHKFDRNLNNADLERVKNIIKGFIDGDKGYKPESIMIFSISFLGYSTDKEFFG